MVFMERKRFIVIFCAFITFIILSGSQLNVYAEEEYSEGNEIRIQVRATVPEDFVEPVSIKYEGKNKKDNQIDIVLDYEHEYMTIITVPRDLYTLKHNNTAQGYTADCAAAFTVENAETDHTYWLPVTVNTDNDARHEKDGPLNLLVRADFEAEEYDGDISVRYSGTHGNLIIADLNAGNGYQTVVQIMKDIYTKEAVTVSDAYHSVAQYSFDLSRAESENYLLDIVVRRGETAVEESDVEEVLLPEETDDSLREVETEEDDEEKNEVRNQKIVFEIADYEKAHLEESVYVAYAGADNVIEVELNESDHYSLILEEPYDVYELLYITCYDNESLIFEASQEIIRADGSEAMIPVRIFVQDGHKDGRKDVLIPAVILIAGVILLIFIISGMKKRKGDKKEKVAEGNDDFDESLYRDDEFGPDDFELDLDDD